MRYGFPALLLTACGGGLEPDGVWLIRAPADGGSTDCSVQTGENFLRGDWPAEEEETEDTEWSYEDEDTYGDELFFAQIETVGEDEAVLVLGTTVAPGAWDPQTESWLFSWTDEERHASAETHEAGYTYGEVEDSSYSLELSLLLLDEDHAQGTLSTRSVGRTTWTETDAWDSATVGVSYGQIPASTYLEPVDDTLPSVENAPDSTDCEAAECALWFQTTCGVDDDFTATRAGYEDEDVYAYLQYATQPGG